MKKAAAIAGIVGAAVCVAATASGATSAGTAHDLTAAMTPGQVVTPKNKPARFPSSAKGARGTFSATTSADGKTLKWRISYSHLDRPKLVIADIHIGKPGKFGPILMRLCAPCKANQSGVKKLKSGYARRLSTGLNWVTLITEKYPNGIVRGQVKVK